jgi:hypothetical protein
LSGEAFREVEQCGAKHPTTNPICTDVVSQARPDAPNPQTPVKVGTSIEAENQTAIASSSAMERTFGMGHFRR